MDTYSIYIFFRLALYLNLKRKTVIHHNLILVFFHIIFHTISSSFNRLYSNILQAMFGLLNQGQPPLVQDNICGAVSRMIMSSPQSLPLDQVLFLFYYY